MQWVVTTGRTVDEARDRALDALGIDESEVELEVLDEPRATLFGLRRTEARVRARVRPTRPRPKVDRRNRRKGTAPGGRRRRTKRGDERAAETAPEDASTGTDTSEAPSGGSARSGNRSRRRGRSRTQEAPTGSQATPAAAREPDTVPAAGSEPDADRAEEPATPAPVGATPAPGPAGSTPTRPPRASTTDETDEPPTGATGDSMSDISLDEQQPSALGFVQGLVDAFGIDADVAAHPVDEEHLEISVTGEDLGLLVGPRGSTLNSIQELTRTAVAQQHSGRLQGRLRVDVAGYRARRKEALERFAAQQAERVKETGTRIALEPMSPPDRKIVHDAINDIEGVRTTSEGEDRRRHVVILPD